MYNIYIRYGIFNGIWIYTRYIYKHNITYSIEKHLNENDIL